MTKILSTDHITKSYGAYQDNRQEVLKGIDLEIYSGEFTCIMGASGSGKTTLLNLLSTLDIPTTGCVYIQNQDVKKLTFNQLGSFRYQHLGFVFQNFYLVEELSVYDNIATPLIIHNENPNKIKTEVHQVSKILDIENLLDKKVNQCSRGQKQRIAICRAIITHPTFIVADEPTGNLDSTNATILLKAFQTLNKEYGTSIILVTHDLNVASYATKIHFLENGLISKTLNRNNLTQLEFFNQIYQEIKQ